MLLVFVALAVAGDRALAHLAEHVVLRSGLRFSQLYAGRARAAILVLGDSRGVNAFFPEAVQGESGRSVFNLSFNGTTPVVHDALFADYLETNGVPELLFLEATSVLSDPSYGTIFKPFMGRSRRIATMIRGLDPLEHGAAAAVHLYRFNSELALRALFYLGRSDQGWVNRNRIAPETVRRERTLPPETTPPEVDERNLEALCRLVARARRAGTRVRIVASPYLPAYRKRLAWWPALLERLETRCGVAVDDFSLSEPDPAAFADRLHLNVVGARRFARLLHRRGLL